MRRKKIAIILGTRPDIIRASLILRYLREDKRIKTVLIWSGQHYSDNLKDIFFRELKIVQPDFDLKCHGKSDAETVSSLIARLYDLLKDLKPEITVFLGDTNTVVGCLAAAQLNIPIAHIEGCMRSYDWRMPEEKYRILVDHLADVIYAYLEEYKKQGIREGLNPDNIIVVGNPIVDILNEYYFKQQKIFEKMANVSFFTQRGIEKRKYLLMTCHRRENVGSKILLKTIFHLVGDAGCRVYFPASYRTQSIIKEFKLQLPNNLIMVNPVGYQEFLLLLNNSRGVVTDSGTVVEEASVLNVPSIQLRKSTERPQVYDVGASVKFDPTNPNKYPSKQVYRKFDSLYKKRWSHNLGDGKTSRRITEDLISRVLGNNVNGHLPEKYNLPIVRSYREDEIKVSG